MIDHEKKIKIFNDLESKLKKINLDIIEVDYINFQIIISNNLCLHIHHFYRNIYGDEMYSFTCDVFNLATKNKLAVNLLYDYQLESFSGIQSLSEVIEILKEDY